MLDNVRKRFRKIVRACTVGWGAGQGYLEAREKKEEVDVFGSWLILKAGCDLEKIKF